MPKGSQNNEEVERIMSLGEYDFYVILGISADADAEAIKKAYKQKALLLHPDKFGSEEERASAQKAFQRLTVAKDSLLNAPKRQKFNQYLTRGYIPEVFAEKVKIMIEWFDRMELERERSLNATQVRPPEAAIYTGCKDELVIPASRMTIDLEIKDGQAAIKVNLNGSSLSITNQEQIISEIKRQIEGQGYKITLSSNGRISFNLPDPMPPAKKGPAEDKLHFEKLKQALPQIVGQQIRQIVEARSTLLFKPYRDVDRGPMEIKFMTGNIDMIFKQGEDKQKISLALDFGGKFNAPDIFAIQEAIKLTLKNLGCEFDPNGMLKAIANLNKPIIEFKRGTANVRSESIVAAICKSVDAKVEELRKPASPYKM